MPDRIRLYRYRGFRLPENTVSVARPTKWGNPYLLSDVGRCFPSLTVQQCAQFVVNQFRDLVRAGTGYPSVDEIRAELAGKNLACWCWAENPCHADVLLELSNSDRTDDASTS